MRFNALKKGNQNESASLLVQGAYNSITNNTYNYFLIILVIIVIKMINLFYSSALKIDGIKTLILSILKKNLRSCQSGPLKNVTRHFSPCQDG